MDMGGGSTPRFRRDLEASGVEADGVPYVEVADPQSGRSFRFYDFEHEAALALDGSPLEEVTARLRDSGQLDLTVDQMAAFADQLQALGFLDSVEAAQEAGEAPPIFPAVLPEESSEMDTPPVIALPEAPVPAPEPAWERPPAVEPVPLEAPALAAEALPPIEPALPAPAPAAPIAFSLDGLPEREPPAARPLGISGLALPPPASKGPEPSTGPETASKGFDLFNRSFDSPAKGFESVPTRSSRPAILLETLTAYPPVESREPDAEPAFEAEAEAAFEAEAEPALEAEAEPALEAEAEPALGAEAPGEAASTPPPVPLEARTPPPSPFVATADDEEDAIVPLKVSNGANGEGVHDLPGLVGVAPTIEAKEKTPVIERAALVEVAESLTVTGDGPRPTDEQAVLDTEKRFAAMLGDRPQAAVATPISVPSPEPAAEDAGAEEERAPETARPETQTARPVRSTRGSLIAIGVLMAAAAIILSGVFYRYLGSTEEPPVAVRTMVPSPTSVYRWFASSAKVEIANATAYTFPAGGKVAEILPPGSRFGAGDVLALLEAGRHGRVDLGHHRERLAYYEQMRDTMATSGNKAEVRQAELKIAEKKRLVADAQATLAKQAILASQPGEVAEALVAVGALVKPNDPAVRAKGSAHRAVFELGREEAEKARRLGFCRVEVEGKPLDCSVASEGGDETHLALELPADPVVAAGKPVRLARARFDAVFAVPTSAIFRVGDTDRLYVAAPGGRAELRVVSIAERGEGEAIVTQGLDVGDQVIVDVPRDLRADTRVLVTQTLRQ
jgi:multidrug efflux pump subunit AcrA (membrane-fusion protein)